MRHFLFLLILLPLPLSAQEKSGVSPSAISLPSGPGSIEGLGPSFEPQLNTGTASYSVDIETPPGVAGHEPSVTLSYNGGSGNGPLGIGWSMDLPSIHRQTDKGLPAYTAANINPASEDIFLFGGEELVPLSDGTYRCENEVEFIRFEKAASTEAGPIDAWTGTLPDGSVFRFGISTESRITRTGSNPNSFADTYEWKLASHIDVNGNVIEYQYATFSTESTGVLYPVTIEYAKASESIHHRIVFTYSGSADFPENRTDIFSDYRAGFEMRTSKLLRDISVFTDGNLVRRYELGYDPHPDLTLSGPNDIPLGFNLLHTVTQYGNLGTETDYLPPLRFAYSQFHTETVSATDTSKAGFGAKIVFERPEFHAVNGGFNFLRSDANRTTVIDINSDGLDDFISSGENAWFAYLNRGNGNFSGEVLFESSQADGKRLDMPNLTVADLDADGIADLFEKGAAGDRILMHRNLNDFRSPYTLDENEVLRWGPEATFSDETGTSDFGNLDISDPAIRTIDLDFDKRIDVMRPFDFGDGTGGVEYIYNRPSSGNGIGTFESRTVFSGGGELPGDWVADEARFDSLNPMVRFADLADLNGDRLLDWVTLAVIGEEIWIDYWPNANGGNWASRKSTERLLAPGSQADDFRFMDVNADGLTDLVRVDAFQLTFWINTGGDEWSDPIIRTDAPPFTKGLTVLRTLDVNGNGTPDLFWDNSALPKDLLPKGTPTYSYFDFVGDLKPNLLQVIDNGIGRRTLIEYKSSTDDYLAALAEGHPWTRKLPTPVTVVTRTTTSIGLDLNDDGAPDEYHMDTSYFDGFYDVIEKEFRGFSFAEQIMRGDDYQPETGLTIGGTGTAPAPTSVIRHRFLTGGPDGIDNDDYREGYIGPTATDEDSGTGGDIIASGRDRGGYEEEALKGNEVLVEEIDGAILNAPSAEEAGFFACARNAAEAAASNPFSPEAMRCSPDKYVYSRVHTDWKVRRLYRHVDVDNPPGRFADDANTAPTFSLQEKSVSFVFNETTEAETIETNGLMVELFGAAPIPYPTRSPKVTRSRTEYDDYGNVTLEFDNGLVDPNVPENLSFMDDEIVTRTIYALSGSALGNWLIRLPATQRVEDENGIFVSESRTYYDGQEFVGLPLGEVGNRGLAKREEKVVTENPAILPELEDFSPQTIDRRGDPRLTAGASIVNHRVAHDVYGNAIAVLDPLGRIEDVHLLPTADAPTTASPAPGNLGHIQIVQFDADRHVYPVEERFVLGEGKNDLVTTADYDPGYGVVIRTANYNGNDTLFVFDAFSRLVKKILPGDTPDRPTEAYSYRPGDSHRNLIYEYDEAGQLMTGGPQGASPPVANRVESREREDVSDSLSYNTVDSIVYQSGHGQDLMKLEEDEEPGRWVVQDARLYNLRGSEWAIYQPYYRNNSDLHLAGEGGIRSDGGPVAGTDRKENRLDATGRPIEIVNPSEVFDGTRTFGITQHLPYETWYYDEEDTNPNSPHVDTPSVEMTDGLDRLIEVQEMTRLNDDGSPSGTMNTWSTRYDYDLMNNMVSVTDSQGNVRWARYDGMGRVLFYNDTDRGTMTFVYNDASKVIEQTDAKGQAIRTTYDGLNRVVTEDYLDEGAPNSYNHAYDPNQPLSESNRPDVLTLHDELIPPFNHLFAPHGQPNNGKGLPVAYIDLSGEKILSYDERGRIESTLKRIPDPVSDQTMRFYSEMSYDALNRMIAMTYPDGDRVHFEYNPRSLLESIVGGTTMNASGVPEIIPSVDYHPSGQMKRRVFGNGIVTESEYDPRLRLRSLTAFPTTSPDQPKIDYDYDLDAKSNMLSITDRRPASVRPAQDPLRNTQTFSYDDLSRLTSVGYSFSTPGSGVTDDGGISYRYDRIGNLLSKTSNLKRIEKGTPITDLGALTYGGSSGTANRIGRTNSDPGPHALTSTSSGIDMEYDANGNIVRSGTMNYEWDFLDRMVAAEDDSMRVEFTYDYTDTRVAKKVFEKNEKGLVSETPDTFTLYVDESFEIRDGIQPVKFVLNSGAIQARITGTITEGRNRIQWIPLSPGWNPISVAVGTDNLGEQIGYGTDSNIERILRYDEGANDLVSVTPMETIASPAILWIEAASHSVLEVSGIYSEPSEILLMDESQFLPSPGLGLASLSDLLPENFELASMFDTESGNWNSAYGGELSFLSSLPKFLSPGAVLFLKSSMGETLESPEPTSQIQYYIQDYLGSLNVLTDGTGETIEETVYFPYGHPRETFEKDSEVSSRLGRYGYAEKELDEETGLEYFEARYLSGPLGRFMSVDPEIDPAAVSDLPQMLNSYCYAGNNPMSQMDPDGRYIRIQGDQPFQKLVKETLRELEKKSKTAASVIQNVNKSKTYKVTISKGNPKEGNFYLPDKTTGNNHSGSIEWNPYQALRFDLRGGGFGEHPPAVGLIHELAHAEGDMISPEGNEALHKATAHAGAYHNLEERRVIHGVEQKVARDLGHPLRHNHGGDNYRVKGPFATAEKKSKPVPMNKLGGFLRKQDKAGNIPFFRGGELKTFDAKQKPRKSGGGKAGESRAKSPRKK